MSKEITPQEALNQLNNFISREKHIDSERNKTINKCVDTLSQALDRLEQLEKENQGLKNKNTALKIKVRAWEIQGKKYKKVIDILKKKVNILAKCIPYYNYKAMHSAGKITDEELEVLESV